MKSFLWQALLAITFPTLLCASQRPAPNTYELQAEYLYFQPLFDQGTYAVETTNPASRLIDLGTLVDQFDWESAYRIALLYGFCNCKNDFEIRWTHLHANGHDSISDSGLAQGQLTTQGYPAVTGISQAVSFISSSDLTLTYYALEGLLGQFLFETCRFELFGQIGIQYANFDFHENVYYRNGTLTEHILNRSESWWTGPEFAINFNYDLVKTSCYEFPFAFCGSIRSAFLVGKTKNKFFGESQTSTFANTEEKVWRIIPYFDVRLGFNYTWCLKTLKVNLEAGYEILDYISALQSMRFYDVNQSGGNFNLTSTLGFHGPYLALNLGY